MVRARNGIALSAQCSAASPNVLTLHGNMRLIATVNQSRPFSFLWLAGKLERLTLSKTDGVVCITRYTREAVTAQTNKNWVVPTLEDHCPAASGNLS